MRARTIHEVHIVLSFEEKCSSKFSMAENSEKYPETAQHEEISVAEETALLGEDVIVEDGDAESQEITMHGLAKLMNQ